MQTLWLRSHPGSGSLEQNMRAQSEVSGAGGAAEGATVTAPALTAALDPWPIGEGDPPKTSKEKQTQAFKGGAQERMSV